MWGLQLQRFVSQTSASQCIKLSLQRSVLPKRYAMCLTTFNNYRQHAHSFSTLNKSPWEHQEYKPWHQHLKVYSTESLNGPVDENTQTPSYRIIYRLPYIRGLRLLSRMKLAQTGLTFCMIPLCGVLFASGKLGINSVLVSLSVASFASIMLIVMSELFRKTVGLLSIREVDDQVRISHMNFWGKREDSFYELTDIVPLADVSESGQDIFVKLRFYSDFNRHYYLFLKHGEIRDIEALTKILGSLNL